MSNPSFSNLARLGAAAAIQARPPLTLEQQQQALVFLQQQMSVRQFAWLAQHLANQFLPGTTPTCFAASSVDITQLQQCIRNKQEIIILIIIML